MKKVPFKLKITLWYSGFIILILALTLSIIYAMSASSLKNKADKSMNHALSRAKKYVSFEKGIFKYDPELLSIDEAAHILIYDAYGNLLYGNVPRLFPVDAPFTTHPQSINLPTKDQYLYKDEDLIFLEGSPKLVLRVVYTYTSTNVTLRSFLVVSLILGPIGLIFAIFGGFRLMNVIFRPIETVRKTAQDISVGDDLNLRIEESNVDDELGRLIETFNHMLQRLEDAFERERQFTDDISHELRTPLTSMLLDVEMMNRSESVNRKALKRLYEQTKWMVDLVDNMSLISQNPSIQKLETRNLKQTLLTLISFENYQVILDMDDDLEFKTDIFLFGRMVTNLIKNSFQYGATQVIISAKRVGSRIEMMVEDDGIGIEKQHLSKIWDRFYRVDRSRTDVMSSGLGLSFVKMAIETLGWRIRVESQVNKFTRFIIYMF